MRPMRFQYKIAVLFALLLISLVTPGCTNQSHAEALSPPCPSNSPHSCRVVIPPCQPPALLGMGMPHDAVSQLGFLPYVATWLPDAVTWYTAQAYPSAPSPTQLLPSQPRPLMRIGYGFWFPRPYNAYALHGVIAFDESPRVLGPTININVPGQTLVVTSKTPVEINGHAGTLFELRGSSGTTNEKNETRVIGVVWQVGTLWVRVTAVTSGRYSLLSNGEGDDVVAWEGTSTDALLRVARSARSYTGCDRNVSGVS